MPQFEIQEDYTETGTNYYTVTAKTLENAIKKIRTNGIKKDRQRIWDYVTSFEASREIN